MRLQIVVPDQLVAVDGEWYEIDGLAAMVPPGLHALQWYGGEGEEEYPGGNEPIDSLTAYQPVITAWQAAKAAATPPAPTLQDVIRWKVAEINQWRDQQALTFEWGGYRWDSGHDGSIRVMGCALAGIAPPNGFWTSADNVDVSISTPEEMQAMYMAMVERASAIHVRQRQMKLEVEALTDIAAVGIYAVGWGDE